MSGLRRTGADLSLLVSALTKEQDERAQIVGIAQQIIAHQDDVFGSGSLPDEYVAEFVNVVQHRPNLDKARLLLAEMEKPGALCMYWRTQDITAQMSHMIACLDKEIESRSAIAKDIKSLMPIPPLDPRCTAEIVMLVGKILIETSRDNDYERRAKTLEKLQRETQNFVNNWRPYKQIKGCLEEILSAQLFK